MDRKQTDEPSVLAWMSAGVIVCLCLTFILHRALRDERDVAPIVIQGGGFLFNYRISEISYGFTAGVARPVPIGSRLVARFADPAGGTPIERSAMIEVRRTRVFLSSGPVKNVVKGKPYRVALELQSRQGAVLWKKNLVYRSRLDGTMIGDKPLTIGPGYTPNPRLVGR